MSVCHVSSVGRIQGNKAAPPPKEYICIFCHIHSLTHTHERERERERRLCGLLSTRLGAKDPVVGTCYEFMVSLGERICGDTVSF